MTRINLFGNTRDTTFLTWGKNASAVVFAAVLIICSIAVGCSSEKPQTVTSNNQIPAVQPQPQSIPATSIAQTENKPVQKKRVVHKKPATVNYADKTYGVTFEYPRRYAIETGDAATQLVMSNPIPMNFVQPGGVALAAVELPETNYVNTDFSSASFNVSVHKTLNADQCGNFAVPQPKAMEKSDATPIASTKSEVANTDTANTDSKTEVARQDSTSKSESSTTKTEGAAKTDPNKLLIGDMELRATEAVSGEGTRQSDSKYFHVYQNGACYEFALNVTTDASEEGLVKHVDRDKVFTRLEQILATVKINPIAPEEKAETQPPSETPAQ
ncbi:MAG TPA: hypothetical protein VJQ54_23065 [Candidatus Sulfotelmatobacter sp.]|nr:hypothetical protein [Candidatus Sulfotelmatobacter sp.]